MGLSNVPGCTADDLYLGKCKTSMAATVPGGFTADQIYKGETTSQVAADKLYVQASQAAFSAAANAKIAGPVKAQAPQQAPAASPLSLLIAWAPVAAVVGVVGYLVLKPRKAPVVVAAPAAGVV